MQLTMATSERPLTEQDDSRRNIIIVVAIVAALAIGALFYFLMRASSSPTVEPTLEGALRAGTPEFAEYAPKIFVEAPEADWAKRALGDIIMNLQTTVRNFTGKTLIGLEIRGSVVDHQGKPVRQQTAVVIPSRQSELGPNHSMAVRIRLEGMTDSDDRANIKMEVTGFKFKN
jgi:flagellar basal body-associated protein FliL